MFKLFTLLNRANATKQAIQNPRAAGSEFIKGIIEGYALLFGFWVAGVLGILAILGFTDWLQGPYGWAEILFYIALSVLVLIVVGIYLAYKAIKKQVKKFETKVRSSLATKVEVTDVDSTDLRNTKTKTSSTTARLKR